MPETTTTRTILILGASYAGLGSAHYLLKYVFPRLPTDITYQVVLVDPSSKWYQRHASPRAAAGPDLVSADLLFLDIAPGLKQYGENFRFVQGKAVEWDVEGRQVKIEMAGGNGEEVVVGYHALILATGTKSFSPLFSLQGGGHEEIQDALSSMHGRLATAKSIVLAGGGPAGVETAAEFGEVLNGAAGWFASRPKQIKTEITVITNAAKLLPELRESSAKAAEGYLARVGVDVRYHTKVASAQALEDGKTRVVLHDGEEMVVDVYVPAMGVRPMSEYVPARLRDEKGYVRQNEGTLRVDGAGARVYAIGDVGAYSQNRIYDILEGVPVLATNLERDLVAAREGDGEGVAVAVGKDRMFTPLTTELQIVPVGRSKGVGAIFGWWVPSWFVWMLKGRDYMVPKGPEQVDGRRWGKEVPWKVKEQ